MNSRSPKRAIAILGGTGHEGSGIALRLGKAGHRIILGSRDAQRASETANELSAILGNGSITGAENRAAAATAEIVILTVPYTGQAATVTGVRDLLKGKILIDATVPLVPPKVSRVQLPEGNSAVAAIQRLLGDDTRIVSAFQNVSAQHLRDLAHDVDCDVLVCGDDAAACQITNELIADMGMRGLYAGPICNSVAAEALTSILITINQKYKAKGAGIRFTNVPSIELNSHEHKGLNDES